MADLENLPAEGPATLGGVKAFLSITDDADNTRLSLDVAAVNHRVRGWRCCVESQGQAVFTPNVVEGANMLAGRLFTRRNSPNGVAAFGEMGPVYVSRNDPDVAMLLGLGSYAGPQVG